MNLAGRAMRLTGRAIGLADRAMSLAGRAMGLADRAMGLAGRAMGLTGRAMLRPLTLFFFVIVLTLTIASCGGSGEGGAVVSDKKKVEQIKSISMSQPELALSMLDSAEVLRTMPMYDVNALRAIVYNNSSNDNTKALHYALLASTDSLLTHNDEKRLAVATVLAYQYFKCGIYDRCLLTAEQAITLARKLKAADKEATILNTKGMCESEIGWLTRRCARSTAASVCCADRFTPPTLGAHGATSSTCTRRRPTCCSTTIVTRRWQPCMTPSARRSRP